MKSLLFFVILATLYTLLNASATTYLRPLPDPMDPRFRTNPIESIDYRPTRPSGFAIPCYGNRCSGHNIKCCAVHTPTGTTGRCINPQFETC